MAQSFEPMPARSLDRRSFIFGSLTLGASAATIFQAISSAVAQVKPHRIDVHHHISPPTYVTEIAGRNLIQAPTRDWTPARSVEDMDKAGVAIAITSVTTPGLSFAEQGLARRLARECNEYATRLASDHPGRFGTFAMLPLPDIDGSLAELAYALDVLKADGVALFTSYGNRWLGDSSFTPVMDELNRRAAVVYTHPRTADCCHNLIPGVPEPIIEYGTDTTRTIASLVFSGGANKYRNAKFIFSHAGGTLPFLTDRFVRLPLLDKSLQAHVPEGVLPELKRFYYDTAQAAHPMALASLLKLVSVSQVVFGTDFPFRTSLDHVIGLQEFGLGESDLRAIDRDNAIRLLPRYA